MNAKNDWMTYNEACEFERLFDGEDNNELREFALRLLYRYLHHVARSMINNEERLFDAWMMHSLYDGQSNAG